MAEPEIRVWVRLSTSAEDDAETVSIETGKTVSELKQLVVKDRLLPISDIPSITSVSVNGIQAGNRTLIDHSYAGETFVFMLNGAKQPQNSQNTSVGSSEPNVYVVNMSLKKLEFALCTFTSNITFEILTLILHYMDSLDNDWVVDINRNFTVISSTSKLGFPGKI